MPNTNPMVGMGNQMVPPYGATMQNQMGTMGMGPQVIADFYLDYAWLKLNVRLHLILAGYSLFFKCIYECCYEKRLYT